MKSEILNLTYYIRHTTYDMRNTKDYVRIYQRIMQNKPNLPDAQMNISSSVTMHYENTSDWTLVESKPKQTQFQTRQRFLSARSPWDCLLHKRLPRRGVYPERICLEHSRKSRRVEEQADQYFCLDSPA